MNPANFRDIQFRHEPHVGFEQLFLSLYIRRLRQLYGIMVKPLVRASVESRTQIFGAF